MIAARQQVLGRCSVLASRAFSSSPCALAMAKLTKSEAQARREARLQAKSAPQEKKKKGGMTHLRFGDAVRTSGFEKSAVDLAQLDVEDLTAENIEHLQKHPVTYTNDTEKKLFKLGLFKKYQHHEATSRPVSLATENTMDVFNTVVLTLEKPSKENKLFLTGEKGVGKSTLLAQTNALALSKYKNDVVLLSFSQPINIVNGSSDYIYNKEQEIYQQPMFTKKWIRKVLEVNLEVFKKMPLTKDIKFTSKKTETQLKKGENTLFDYLSKSRDFGKALSGFKFFIDQVMEHSKTFPVLVTVDDFNALAKHAETAYRHPDFTPIHLKELEVSKFIMGVLSGDVSFHKGGVLAAESKQIGETTTLQVGLRLTEYDPYMTEKECDRYVAEALLKNGGMQVKKVKNFTAEESKALLEFFQECGVLKIRPYPHKKVIKADGSEDDKAVGAFPEVVDAKAQLDRIVLYSYNITQGNPGSLFRTAVLAY